MTFGRLYVWSGPSGGGFSDFHNWTPVFTDQQPPSDNDLVIFNRGGALSVDGQNGRVAEIDVVLATTLTIQHGLEGTGTVSGVALNVDSGGTVIVGAGAAMIGIGAVDVIGFSGAGTVIVTAGGHMDDNGMVLGDRAGASGAVTVDGAGSILVVANNLPGAPNGVLIVGNGGTGALAVRNGGSLGSSFVTLGEQVGSSGAATLNAAAWSGGLFTIGKAGSGSVAVQSGGVLTTVQMVIGAGGLLDVSGALGAPGTVTLSTLAMAGGTLDVTHGGIVALGAATGPAGAVLVSTGATFTGLGKINGNVTLSSAGTLQATGAALGALALNGNVTGTGTLAPLMTLDLNGTVTAGVAVVFAAPSLLQPGVLILENAAGEGGTISGFAVGNTIEIPGLKFTRANFTAGALTSPGTLVLSGGTETPLSLPVVGGYGVHDFIATSGASGTTVTLACFVTGTRIATSLGALPVERLEILTRVQTHFSGFSAVKWIGHRRTDCRRHPQPWDVLPVRVRAGAFGDATPTRDVLLSPDHAVFVNGVLIPVRYLINDATIVQEPAGVITYWHVELDRHDVLLAEGLPAESYLDTGNRAAFENGGAVVDMHPDFARAVWDTRACAPLVRDGPALIDARAMLLRRALRLGHATSAEAALTVRAGGQILLPHCAEDRTFTFDLPARTRSIRLQSRSAMPAHIKVSDPDSRRLGIAVARLALDGENIALTDARLGAGWIAAEDRFRWTDGNAAVATSGARHLSVRTLPLMRYWTTRNAAPISSAATGRSQWPEYRRG